jgi:hypothetical protein
VATTTPDRADSGLAKPERKKEKERTNQQTTKKRPISDRKEKATSYSLGQRTVCWSPYFSIAVCCPILLIPKCDSFHYIT